MMRGLEGAGGVANRKIDNYNKYMICHKCGQVSGSITCRKCEREDKTIQKMRRIPKRKSLKYRIHEKNIEVCQDIEENRKMKSLGEIEYDSYSLERDSNY